MRDPNNSVFPCGLLTTDDGTSSLLKHLSSRLVICSVVCHDLPMQPSIMLTNVLPNHGLPSLPSVWVHEFISYASGISFSPWTSRNFPFNSKIRPKVPDPILKIPHWSHANSVRDHQKLYAQLYGSPEPRPIDQQNSEICRAEAATREPALIGLLFVECSLPKNLTGKFWFKTHQIPSIS